MSLPAPENYSTWQDWARAVNRVMQDSGFDPLLPQVVGGGVPGGGGGVATSVNMPAGFKPIWLSDADAALYLGNSDFDPPTAPDLFQIDNANLLDAVISTNKVQTAAIDAGKILDGAVGTLKLAASAVTNAKVAVGAINTANIVDAAIVSAKIGTAAVLTANIQDAAIINAKILDGTILTAKISDAAISTAKIANAAVVSALIGDAQIITAKIADLAVNDLKVANAAITSAKIANLAVGAAAIQNLAVGNAQIANLAVDNAKIANATILTAKIALAQITQALIANLAVGTAQIIDASVLSAKIADATILAAKIADATITNAKIADATIASAKIANLVVDKLLSGTLDATIDVGTGILKFTIGGNSLYIGRGFGTSNQFFLWFGPTVATTACTELNGTIWFKTNGDAYFGGSLSAGTLTTSASSSSTSSSVVVETAVFGSNGGTINVTLSLTYTASRHNDYLPSQGANWDAEKATISPTPTDADGDLIFTSAGNDSGACQIDLYRSLAGGAYALVASLSRTGSWDWDGVRPNGVDPGYANLHDANGGSLTYTDPTNSTQTRQYKAVMSARNPRITDNLAQRVSIMAVEQ